jgi:hypothetical protein
LGLILFLASAQPKLNIAPQGGEVAISWSATNSTNIILQQTLAPWASNLWTNMSQPPSSNNGAYYVLLSPTNDASFFRLFLAFTNLADKPDDAFTDSNGDGIDGDVTRAIFVATSGNDSSAGTMSQPVRTIAEGIRRAAAANKDVYVAAGVYSSSTLNLSNGVSIYGGYNPADWSRSDANIPQFNASAAVAVSANNLTNSTTLDHLTITSANATNFAESSCGILASRSPGLIIRRCTVQSGNGGNGLSGSGGIAGANGGNGVTGQPGCEDSTGLFCGSCSRPQGGTGGTNSCDKLGGRGGDAGHGTAGGSPGLAGGGGTLGGAGAPGESANGIGGDSGTNGINGTDGLAAAEGDYGASGFVPLVGGNGLDGTSGNGGGGGGGGGGGTTDCDSYGSSGGGGGGGGCGGTGATGGQSGGGSFAVYLFASDAHLEFCTLITGNGGIGGNGGNGGAGGIHGIGGNGGPYGGSSEQDDGGNGARGGDGGDGGRGGHGGGGAGGPSIGITHPGGSTPQLASPNFVLGSGGLGGSSSGNAGSNGMVSNVYP